MISISCPSCGAAVTFRTEFSTHAVCPGCDSLLVRQGAKVELIGKVAELQPDGSPLRLGSGGTYKGSAFEVIGRLQVSYGDGYWNEWHILYADGKSGWLGEAMGEYFINAQAKVSGGLPASSSLPPGSALSLAGEAYVVTSRNSSRLVSLEGELPFGGGAGEDFFSIDLKTTGSKAATIDYSEDPPLLFTGEYLPFKSFHFTGLSSAQGGGDDEPLSSAKSEGVESFNCPSCGAPHTVAGGVRSKVLVCQYCGSAIDITNDKLKILWQEESMRNQLKKGTCLEIGSVAAIEGDRFQLIGFIKKSVRFEGINYPWVEYLLYHRLLGYRWIVESDGHFMLMKPLDGLPSRGGDRPVGRPDEQAVFYQDKKYQHFQTSSPRVDAVAGEFYWRVSTDEKAQNHDYICPPHLLSAESSATGIVWSWGEYLEHDAIKGMFGLKQDLPSPIGVAAAQPNPYQKRDRLNWITFSVATLLSFLLLYSGILAGSGEQVFSTSGATYQTFRRFAPQSSNLFTVSGHGNLAFDFEARLGERWMFFDTELVAVDGGQSFKVGRTLQGEAGSALVKSTVRLSGVAAGQYKLNWKVSSGTNSSLPENVDEKHSTEAVPYKISLRRGVAVWSWWWLMVWFLLFFALIDASRKSSFETSRWYNSDYG